VTARPSIISTVRRPTGLASVLMPRRERVEDVRRRLVEVGVHRTFFICATPRTGSTMLADVIASSGAAGLALEHFNQESLRPDSRVRLGDVVASRATKAMGTGVFGTKLIWYQLEPFARRLRALRGSEDLPCDRLLIEAVFPTPRYVWITRRDVVAQGVSWWRAKVTRVWQDDDVPQNDAVFDFEAIDERVRLAREQNASWEEWFGRNEIEPLHVTYEELVVDPAAVGTATLDFLGVRVPEGFAPVPRTRRQADGRSDAWTRRYQVLAARR
jgi:LPS sulfotransferase NodH